MIQIAQWDITNRSCVKFDLQNNPVAIVLRRYLKADKVEVYQEEIHVFKDGRVTLYETPQNVLEFLERFDNDERVAPIGFELREIGLYYSTFGRDKSEPQKQRGRNPKFDERDRYEN